ncbi:berberine bridge enzyme-like D-2 isoform X2 [Diospyros lotus]|uniref:berberine bridge enzyme-like D-2 isoform X2 n=1 Tax=Diospyros lotus TaxID=55363 RepID=UPI0022515EAD|nr:berberine bridge enzyme-like D-2 isoform X2 [Diospyros lotus]XP_052202689.1 berberine bridge enzyme-like D-2 isoform X2 [Diospyros lotus]
MLRDKANNWWRTMQRTLPSPARQGTDDSGSYYGLLNFSLQNLRFTDPSLPKPAAIILPTSKEELVSSVLCCKRMALEIRVRCGGHSYEGTSSVVVDGAKFAIIDMMNLDRVDVDLESETAWVEGGATLGQTYHAIAQSSPVHGFSAGSCPTVGISGHIAGGGFGLLSRKYGLAADNVVDALLVNADGEVLDREAMGEEVFWAIRGGGGGIWGIILAWRIKLLRVPQTVTGFIVSRFGTKHLVAKLVHKWQSVAPKLEDAFYLSSFVGASLPESQKTGISATFKGFYLGPRSKVVSILKLAFPELGIVEEDCQEMSWIESVVYFSGLDNGSTVADLRDRYLHQKSYFKAKSDYVRAIIPLGGIEEAIDILDKEPKGYVILDPYGGIMQNINSSSIAFPHRKGNLFAIQYLVEWKEEDNHESTKYIEWIRGFYDSMASRVSWGPRAAYVNYMDLDLGVMQILNTSAPSTDAVEMARVWGQKYFLNNYDKLVRAKTFIDPLNVFRHQQGIPPMSMVVGLSTS